MSAIANYPWHQPAWQQLQHYVQQARVPQALLVSGEVGLGKLHLARQFAQALLCEQRDHEAYACGVCPSCHLFAATTHPDFILLAPEESGKAIGVDRIRQLLPSLALKPQYAGYRVVLIAAAEHLNHAAANAFLKCLEEPNERTVILLETAKPSRLPATIISRCQSLKLTCPEPAMAIAWLSSQQVQQDQAVLLALALGSPLLALHYAQNDTLALRNKCFQQWLQVAKQQTAPTELAEAWLSLPFASLLNWLCSWVADLIKCHYQADSKCLHNPDLQVVLQEVQKRLDLKQLFALYDQLLRIQKQLHTQLNKQLLLETILIQWFNLNCRD